MKITYRKGDVTLPVGDGKKVIAHCCNDQGGWGAGVVLAISGRWGGGNDVGSPEFAYRQWAKKRSTKRTMTSSERVPWKLGMVQFVHVESKPDLWVANMIGQHGTGKGAGGVPPIRYEAIRTALKDVALFCLANDAEVHSPKFGSDLAGGDWNEIEKIIKEELIAKGVKVTIYEYVPAPKPFPVRA